jgi:hypothetical protein
MGLFHGGIPGLCNCLRAEESAAGDRHNSAINASDGAGSDEPPQPHPTIA